MTLPLEMCCNCGNETGKAGRADDSIYVQSYGPLCERCYGEFRDEIIADNTPPLAPCEPSAVPSVEKCVQTFIDGMNECCPEGYVPVKHVGDWERAGIAAVRALFARDASEDGHG